MSALGPQPPGTFLPNTKVTCGSHKVYIERYLSEGGFAHVYVVRIPRENNKHEIAVLKRVAVPDKEHLASMRTEVETMKKLRGHKHIVTYIDSHASQLKGGGYEVFLLMEFCSGGGLIDFMNTRLQHRLTEPEILKIFGDCAEGVACMHYLKPPLLHRDLKVENVLIAKSSLGNPTYKICDFGSTAPPRPAAKTVEEGRLIEEDVQKHTTIQYRSPEMIDIWRKQPIDEKSDIWALGVLLFKLCYYTTPFEDVGQMAILNATFKYPSYPSFSERTKKLIGWMLKEDPKSRPNIFQVVKEVCSMRGTDVPIKDIYANRTHSEVRKNESSPSTESLSSAPVGLQKTAPQMQVQNIPEIAPMRRGRPPAPAQQAPAQAAVTAKPTPSPARGDPFAALDSKNYDVRAGAVDELSQRFPSLNEFSLAHEGGKFPFQNSRSSNPPPVSSKTTATDNLNERVANALADEVFAAKSPPLGATAKQKPRIQEPRSLPVKQSSPPKPQRAVSVKQTQPLKIVQQPTPVRPGVVYKSTATGSSPPPPSKNFPEVSSRPIWRVPDHHRSTSQPRASLDAQATAPALQIPPQRSGMLEIHRSQTQTATLKASNSSRPSLEGGRPSAQDINVSDLSRTKSLTSRSRPTSMYVSSNMDFLRDQEQSRKRPSMETRRLSRQHSHGRESGAEEAVIDDDMDYLRKTEEQEGDHFKSMKDAMKMNSQHRKRGSLDVIKSGTKNILGGRFGDAFKRFEHSEPRSGNHGPVTPEAREYDETQMLSPITGSDATPTRRSEVDETEELPLGVKRELERRRLSQEEKRVAEAAAEYRSRVAAQGTGGAAPSRASTIQRRVQSLLDEGRQAPQPRRTAEGYGKYTESPESDLSRIPTQPNIPQPSGGRPPVNSRKPDVIPDVGGLPFARTQQQIPEVPSATIDTVSSSSAPLESAALRRVNSRPGPHAPPKPKALRTGGQAQWPPSQPSSSGEKPQTPKSAGLAALLAKDLEGVPDYPPRGSSMANSNHHGPPASRDDDLDSFSKRYPSLSGIEMVETEIGH